MPSKGQIQAAQQRGLLMPSGGGLAIPDVTQRAMTVSNTATPFGCCDFFDNCTDQILSLYYRGQLGLLDWMGFNVSDECYRTVQFIDYLRPAQSDSADTPGYLGDPCLPPNGVEFGSCKLTVEDFGRYGRMGPTRAIMKPQKFCQTSPIFFLDGERVNSESDWDMIFAADQLLNDIRKDLIIGNSATPGRFAGLRQWVNTGYDCKSLDSYVVDWNSNDLDGTGGTGAVTINGSAIGTWGLVDVLLDLHMNIKQRISWSPMMRNQQRSVGDTILALPSFLGRALLNSFTCWSICPGEANIKIVTLPNKETRDFRITLNGGLFGNGKIFLDGDEIPLLFYDWEMIDGPTRGDIFYLTGSIGTQRVWEGEHLSADAAVAQIASRAGSGAGGYFSRDGGRVLGKMDFENECDTMKMWMHPRLFCKAPWAQVRFTDVKASTPTGPLSPDPAETSFNPARGSFDPAECA